MNRIKTALFRLGLTAFLFGLWGFVLYLISPKLLLGASLIPGIVIWWVLWITVAYRIELWFEDWRDNGY